MGFNSVLLILNDHLYDIENDPEFGQKVSDAIRRMSVGGDDNRGWARVSPGATVISDDHMDNIQVLAVGENTATRLGTFWGGGVTDKEKILRKVADQLGYRLVRKAEKATSRG